MSWIHGEITQYVECGIPTITALRAFVQLVFLLGKSMVVLSMNTADEDAMDSKLSIRLRLVVVPVAALFVCFLDIKLGTILPSPVDST
jgi:hypothetical protein